MKSLSFFIILIAVAGCATQKTLEATGGSRADGIVELAFEVGGLEVPQIDWADADAKAAKRCNAWNYRAAERFGGYKTQCIAYSQYGCVRQMVTVPYQCTA